MFVPADGIGPVMVYRHYLRNEALTGVSAVAPKVMESRKQYDWNSRSLSSIVRISGTSMASAGSSGSRPS